MTEYVLAQVYLAQQLPQGDSSDLDAAARRLGVAVSSLDSDYGVVPIDVPAGLYAVRVDNAAMPQVRESLYGSDTEGIFSDVRIEPMGPPES